MEEKLCILDNWVYKPHQLCQVEVVKGEVIDGEIVQSKTQSTVFTRTACNVLIQHVHNELTESKDKDLINADYVFKIPMSKFLDKLGAENIGQVNRNLKLLPSLTFITLHKDSIGAFSLIPNIQYSNYDDTMEFTANKILISMIKNDYKLVDINGNVISDSSSYGRIYLRSSHRLANSNYKTMALYEYFIFARKILSDNSKLLSIKIDYFLKIIECSSYNKSSQIIKVLESLCLSMKKCYGLDVYYKCNYDRKYNKIKSVSFRVFLENGNIYSQEIHKEAEKEESNTKTFYFNYKNEKGNIFNFKSKEEHLKLIDIKYTNDINFNTLENIDLLEEMI